MSTRRPAIYARISTKEGQQHLQNQLDACLEFIRRQTGENQDSWRVPTTENLIYTDIESGAVASRPGLNRLLADAGRSWGPHAKGERFDMVIVFALDRLTREGPGRAFELIQKLKGYGVDFVSVTEPHFRTTGLGGDLLIAIAAYVAGEERRAIRERVKAGLKRAREAGAVLGRPTIQVDPAALMRLQSEGLSVRQIARALDTSKSTIERKLRKLKP
jgi:DNA invertase Pin-like site-specific DNA recombinase